VTVVVEQLSRSFRLEEFAVSREHPELVKPVPQALVPRVQLLANTVLQPIRDALGRPMSIISGYRPLALNNAVDGEPTSQHVVGEAADWTCHDIRGAFLTVLDLVRDGKLGGAGQIIGYGRRRGFIHVALPSGRYPRPTLCLHIPDRGFRYRPIKADRRVFAAMLPDVEDRP
jgi:zinc D-Ala-D-Ala carboxypeptidase